MKGKKHSHNAMPVRIRGKDYPSATAAARELGLGVSNVLTMIARGRADRIGLGKGAGGPHKFVPGKQITFAGWQWKSYAAMARDLGWARSQIDRVVKYPDRYREKIVAAIMRSQMEGRFREGNRVG